MSAPQRPSRRVEAHTDVSRAEELKKKRQWLLRCLEKVVGVDLPSREYLASNPLSRKPKTKNKGKERAQQEPDRGVGSSSQLYDAEVTDTTDIVRMQDGCPEPAPLMADPLPSGEWHKTYHQPLESNMPFSDPMILDTLPAWEADEMPIDFPTLPFQNVPPASQVVAYPPDHDPPIHDFGDDVDTTLRFVGPNGQAILSSARIEPNSRFSQASVNFARALGYTFDEEGPPRQICPIPEQERTSCFSSIGKGSPRWFIRDLGIMFRPEAVVPDLRVNIRLAPYPESVDGTPVDQELVNICCNLPYVIIGGPLLERMIDAGYQFSRIPR